MSSINLALTELCEVVNERVNTIKKQAVKSDGKISYSVSDNLQKINQDEEDNKISN